MVIVLGVVMLMQPFALVLYTYSFVTILTGTVLFIIVSHFPERGTKRDQVNATGGED